MAKAKTTIKKITQNAWECTKIFKTGEIEKRIVKDPIDIWSIGNTGVRNPWRIPGGYKVYVESNQVGKIRTAQEQKLFKEKLLLAGEIGGDPKKDADASITRKYRLMFNKYGFAYPEVLKKDGFSQKEIGKIDDITPAGWAFYHANTIQAQQECFLRGLVVQMEPLGERETYSPLRWVLKIMFDLFERTGDYKINYIEFAVCVQTSSPKYELETVVNKILEIRGRRKKYINKKKFDRDLIHNAWKHYFKEEKNFHEYADMNLRYLSASGILKRSGRGITVMPEYKSLAYELTKNVISDATLKERYKLLCQTLQEVMHSNVDNMSYCDKRSMKMDISLSKKKNILNAGGNRENTLSEGEENGKKYNRVFARIFEITSIVTEIKSILQELSMRRLFLILDDYSEIEQTSLVMFCDLIVNTLHNNSDNFVKLKISAYPGRVELGELDRQKVDIRYLDYFQLYAGDKRNEMESMAVAYTERLMDTRLKIYTGKDFDYYFDTTKTSKEEYCKYLFNMTMNVVRHIGLILDYAQELSIIQGERITLNILNEASKRFYKERLVQFFEESKTAKMTYNERIESLELNKLLNQIIDKEKTIKTNIRTNQYTAVIFQKERNNPYTSHFYIAQELEPYLGSLELNFFISKYNEMSNKSGKKVSIYALNYGLCMDENLRWGKPKGNEYRTYFIESPFNFTPVIKNFLSENKKIYCENCMHEFSEEEYNLMKKYGGTCLKCGCKNSIQEKRVLSDEERSEIEEIEKKDNLLEREQYQLLKLLQYSRKDKTATELAQELDVSWQKIGWIAKKIEEDYCYLKKEPRKGKMYYVLSDLGREYLDSITP